MATTHLDHKLDQPPSRDPETGEYVARCACGHEVRHVNKDMCWELLGDHTIPFLLADLGLT